MRFSSLLILALVLAGCDDKNLDPTIIVDNPQAIPFVPPRVSAVDGVAGTAAHFATGIVSLTGFSLNLKLDASDLPTITIALTHDLAGAPLTAAPLNAVRVHSRGVQGNTGFGAVDFGFLPQRTGLYTITVTTAAGSTTVPDALAVVPDFSVTPPAQRVFCGDEPFQIPLAGAEVIFAGNFLGAGTFPAGVDYIAGRETTWTVEGSGCTPVPLSTFPGVSQCTQMTIDYPGLETLSGVPMQHAVVGMEDFFGTAPPFDLFFEASGASPGGPAIFTAATAATVPLNFAGQFAVDGTALPEVTLDGSPVAASAAGCTAAGFQDLRVCTTLQAVVPQGTAPGEHTLSATSLSGCTATKPVTVSAPPVITSITPAGLLCKGTADALLVIGTNFFSAVLLIDGQPVSGCGGDTCEISTAFIAAGAHQVSVRSFLQAPADSAPVSITLNDGPAFVFTPIPSTLLAGAGRSFFVPISSKTGVVQSARFKSSAPDGPTFVPQFEDVPGGVNVITPIDAPPGQYVLTLQDESPCPSFGGAVVTLAQAPVVKFLTFDTAAGQSVPFGPVDARTGILPNFADWTPNIGNPGGALIGFVKQGAPAEAFGVPASDVVGNDLAFLRFDLQMLNCPSADRLTAGQLLMTGFSADNGVPFRLSRPLAPPACGAYSHYDVPLDDSWTFTDNDGGTRAASATDFAHSLIAVIIPGNFSPDGDAVLLDNVVLELAQ